MKRRSKKILALLAAASCLSGTFSAMPVAAEDTQAEAGAEQTGTAQEAQTAQGAQQSESFVLGNSSLNILNGGTMTEDGTDVSGYTGGGTYSNVNVFQDHLYYVSGDNGIMSVDRSTGSVTQVCQPGEPVSQMYVANDSQIYYLAGGCVYRYDIASGATETLEGSGDIQGFIPTAYGMICARGSLFSWNLTAGNTSVADGVFQYYVQDGYLIYTQDGKEYQAEVSGLFDGSAAEDVAAYSLGEPDPSEIQAYSADTEEECPVCEENAKNYSEEEYALSDQVKLGETSDGEISVFAGGLTATQQKMVKRAQEQADIEWTPVRDVKGWDGEMTFKAGIKVKGLPYGQPVNGWGGLVGAYVPWDASMGEFLAAVGNSNSKFYTSRANYVDAPYYSTDCSAFVSYAWGLSSRQWTGSLAQFGQRQSPNVYALQVGDILLHTQNHVLMIADVTYKNNTVVAVTTVEETVPRCKYTVWGEGGSKSLEDLKSKYLDQGYSIYRSNTQIADNKVYEGVDKFSDVDHGWYYDAVKYVFDKGYMTGMSGSTFGVNTTLERSHFVTMLYRIEGQPSVSFQQVFSDVGAGAFYTNAVMWANSTGVAEGYANGAFGVSDHLTREQLVTMLYRYAQYKGLNPQASGNLSSFPDAGSVSDFAKDAMKWAISAGIITGDQGKINPQGSASRAQCAVMIQRYENL